MNAIATHNGWNNTVRATAHVDDASFTICADNSKDFPNCAGSFIVPSRSRYMVTTYAAGIATWAQLK